MRHLKYHLQRILLLAGCFIFLVGAQAQNWDINLLKSVNPQDPNSGIMRGLSASAYPVGIATPAALLAAGLIKKDKTLTRQGLQAAGAVAIAAVVTEGLKKLVDRERPYIKYPLDVHSKSVENDPSFPSGHASIAFSTATTLTLEFKKWYVAVPAYAWAVGVGYSRLYEGEHYPTDIIGSAVVGAGSAVLSRWLTKKVFH